MNQLKSIIARANKAIDLLAETENSSDPAIIKARNGALFALNVLQAEVEMVKANLKESE